MTLNQAVDTALNRSPAYLMKKESVKEAREQKRSKKGRSYGHIDLVGSYTRYNIPRTLAPIVPPITSDVASGRSIGSLGVRYDLMLFGGFADLASVEIADIGKKISETELGLGKEELIYNIKSLFYKIASLQESRNFAVAYRDALRKLMTDVALEVAAGKKAGIDRLKVASDLENARFNVVKISDTIGTLKARLAALIGVEKVDTVEVPSREERTGDVEWQKSYSYKRAEYEVLKSEKGVLKAKSSLYPKIAFGAYYGNNYGASKEVELWQAGITLNWPLFDFGVRDAEIQRALIAKETTRLKLESTRLKLKSDIIEAKHRISTAEAKVRATAKTLELLKKVEEAERIKYEKGASDMYDLLYAIAKHLSAQSEHAEAKYDLRMQRAYLDYITAGEK